MTKTSQFQLCLFLLSMLVMNTGCKKDDPNATTDEHIDFVKDYNNPSKQQASDVKQTSDGGYIMVGTAYQQPTDTEGDILVIKTDASGNEQWSVSLGKPSGLGTGSLNNTQVSYHEEGVEIEILPNSEGYVLAGNRTYMVPASPTSQSKTAHQTKIVLYKLDINGNPTQTNGTELYENRASTERVSVLEWDASNDVFLVGGYTTNIKTSKTGTDPDNGAYDETDGLLIAVGGDFTPVWDEAQVTLGFYGKDYITDVKVLPNSYLALGTTEIRHQVGGSAPKYVAECLAVTLRKGSGILLNPQYFGDENIDIASVRAVYSAENNVVTLVGHAKTTSSTNAGQLFVSQLGTNSSPLLSVIQNMQFLQIPAPSTATGGTFKAVSIDELPTGFVIGITYEGSLGTDIGIVNLDTNLDLVTGWPYYHNHTSGTINSSNEVAGTAIGTSAAGIAFTGTFDAQTNNSKIGLVQINTTAAL